ncbi:hypothetical protein FACS1894217_14550 [Clostridia bacterium]|nr:hypothetical protein FACS1894217_14550 [Clostridia bacterium]
MNKEFLKSKDDSQVKLRNVKSFEDFKYWFKNVYLLHYKVPTIIVLAAMVFVGWSVWSAVTTVHPDYIVLMGTKYGFLSDRVDALKAELEAVLPDRNDDGKVFVAIDSMYFGDPVNGMDYRMAFMAHLADPDVILVISDDDEPFYQEDDPDVFLETKSLKNSKKMANIGILPEANLVAYIINRPKADPSMTEGAIAIMNYIAK